MADKSYLGTGWAFPPAFIKDKGIDMAGEEEDISQSLNILFSTTPGERVFNYDYGCHIHKWVFDEINLSTKTLISDAIRQAIRLFEPRIRIENIDIDTRDIGDGILWITMDYLILQVNSRRNMVFPFYFREGTNL